MEKLARCGSCCNLLAVYFTYIYIFQILDNFRFAVVKGRKHTGYVMLDCLHMWITFWGFFGHLKLESRARQEKKLTLLLHISRVTIRTSHFSMPRPLPESRTIYSIDSPFFRFSFVFSRFVPEDKIDKFRYGGRPSLRPFSTSDAALKKSTWHSGDEIFQFKISDRSSFSLRRSACSKVNMIGFQDIIIVFHFIGRYVVGTNWEFRCHFSVSMIDWFSFKHQEVRP
jgi:hypothetical protein